MGKIAVIYWSGTGCTEMMANAVYEGIKSVNKDAELFFVTDANEDDIDGYDKVAFGCPASGTEELEEWEFKPFYEAAEEKLDGKEVLLFGSYGWGGGPWMEAWVERADEAGLKVFMDEGIIFNGEPDEETLKLCKERGAEFAK